jgi:alkaline phosphatase D
MKLSRRRALLSLAAVGSAPALGASEVSPQLKGLHFAHGVASGDPLHDRVILWTRLSGAQSPTEVAYDIAADEAFARIITTGKFTTDAGRDYTVKVDAAGLKSGTTYYYRFRAGEATSPTGRTQTLPENTDKLVMAVASCSLHPNGYFNAYKAIAELPEVDVVVHLGDYIYEYGAAVTAYGMTNGQMLGRIPQPPHEMVSLDDYRLRHAQYKADPDLQAAHARAAWICVFDDHEITNDPWYGGAENHNAGEGDWFERKAKGLKAYREWMPIRDPQPGQLSDAIYRSFRFGKLAELIMVETRLLARSKQLDYQHDVEMLTLPDGTRQLNVEAFRNKLNDPARELFGPEQRQWLKSTLQSSTDNGVRWQVLGNQVVMARVAGPDVNKVLGPEKIKTLMPMMPLEAQKYLTAMMGLFSQNPPLPLNLDAWDGYPAERERFYDMIKATNARAVVISGDSHCAWANQLHDAQGEQVGVELGVTSITSPTRWLDKILPGYELAKGLAEVNPEVLDADDNYNGFIRLTLTPDQMIGEWMTVSTITSREFTTASQKTFVARAEDKRAGPLTVV